MIRARSTGMPANEINSSRVGSSPVVSMSIAMKRASRQDLPATASDPQPELRRDAVLNARHGAECFLQRGPRDRREAARRDQVVRPLPVAHLADLMLHSERGEELEGVAQRPRVLGTQGARLTGCLQSRA